MKQNSWADSRMKFYGELNASGLIGNPDEIENFLKSSIEGREYAKFIFTRNLSWLWTI